MKYQNVTITANIQGDSFRHLRFRYVRLLAVVLQTKIEIITKTGNRIKKKSDLFYSPYIRNNETVFSCI